MCGMGKSVLLRSCIFPQDEIGDFLSHLLSESSGSSSSVYSPCPSHSHHVTSSTVYPHSSVTSSFTNPLPPKSQRKEGTRKRKTSTGSSLDGSAPPSPAKISRPSEWSRCRVEKSCWKGLLVGWFYELFICGRGCLIWITYRFAMLINCIWVVVRRNKIKFKTKYYE